MKALARVTTVLALVAAFLLLVRADGGAPTAVPSVSPGARPELVAELRAAQAIAHDPADGGGRAWIDTAASSAGAPMVSSPGNWTIVYEAGPLGIADGGMIVFLPSPFWGWSPPQTFDEAAPGFTRVTTNAQGVALETDSAAGQMLGIRVGGRRLAAGEQVRIAYGDGPAGARADRFAEGASHFWIGVDGDGDGSHSFLEDSPAVAVAPGPPEILIATLPTTARPGEKVLLRLALLDAHADAGAPYIGAVALQSEPDGLDLPAVVNVEAANRGTIAVEVGVGTEGTFRVRATAGALRAETNPLVVFANAARLRWGDLHGHSSFSDGTGLPAEYFAYARDVAGLDVIALTDHDHWGTLPLDAHPRMWAEIRDQVRRFHDPGRFVTLLGYEWTSWIYGHRHVLYFDDDGEVLSSLDRRYEAPDQLWKALRGKRALTFAHHSAGGPIATDWTIPPDPELEPLTEVVSVHGVSEADDVPQRIYSAVPGNFVRDALNRGYTLGFVGSGDSHDGHPGLAHLASPSGGLVAIFSEDLTRAGILAALRQRHVYATNGPRIYLRVSLAGHPMGTTIALDTGDGGNPFPPEPQLLVHIDATDELERVDVIHSGVVADSAAVDGRSADLSATLSDLRAGDYVYVRVVQRDGGMAWSSPFFLR